MFKIYICLCVGKTEYKTGYIRKKILCTNITENGKFIRKCKLDESGDYALSYFFVEKEYYDKETKTYFSLLKIRIMTGKTHQIRVHVQSLGLVLVADKDYDYENYSKYLPWCKRIFLHNIFLRFEFNNVVYKVSSHLPMDLVNAIDHCEKNFSHDKKLVDLYDFREIMNVSAKNPIIKNIISKGDKKTYTNDMFMSQEIPTEHYENDLADDSDNYLFDFE